MENRHLSAEYDSGQELNTKTLELRYCEDERALHVDFHAHPFYEIYFFLEGPVESYVVGGNSYRMQPGDILILPPGVAHYPIFTRTDQSYRRYVLWLFDEQLKQMAQLDPDLLETLQKCREQETYRIRCSNPSVRQQLERYLNHMWQEIRNPVTCRQAAMYGLCLQFLVLLNRTVADEHTLNQNNWKPSDLLDNVLAYIHQHYTEAISLNEVAEQFFTSPSNIELLLARKLGKPFYRYVTECRVIHAQKLISDGMPLKEVGVACGYHDYSNFYRAFTREVGISPSQFRRHQPTDHFQSLPIEDTTRREQKWREQDL